MRVGAIYIAPVKSLALQRVERARVTKRGLAGDREFFLVSDRNRLFTMREYGPLATVSASYLYPQDLLRFEFPDGRAYEAQPVPGEALTARFFGKYDVAAYETPGPWDGALAQFTGMPVRLARAAERRSGVDAFPVSLLSDKSIAALRENSGEQSFDARRFRPNVLIEGADRAHQEDEWLGQGVRVGTAVIRVRMRDERCVMTTLSPDTGLRDHNTLRMIADYRSDQPKEVNFGVYGTVDQEGDIAKGDEVALLESVVGA
jgi:uncharacterized protein YcbX